MTLTGRSEMVWHSLWFNYRLGDPHLTPVDVNTILVRIV